MELISHEPEVLINRDKLAGEKVEKKVCLLNQMQTLFQQQHEVAKLDPLLPVYEVESYLPVEEGTKDGLGFAITTLLPGKVGSEYFMTKGHFHANLDKAEFMWGIKGDGLLLMMDAGRDIKVEKVFPGSLHYVPVSMAHRTINTGDNPFVFGCCWPSDTGHDYKMIREKGFAARVLEINGRPEIIKEL